MNSPLFEENGHLTKISLKAFKQGSLSDNELMLISQHICTCDSCSDDLSNSFSEDELIHTPLGFEEEILSKIKSSKRRKNEFVFYSLRVTIAASIALVFVFSNGLNFVANTKTTTIAIRPMSLSSVYIINKSLNDLSQNIIKLEVFNNDKK